MAHIKTITVKAIYWWNAGYYWGTTSFTTFTDDNGNKTYLIDGKEATKEEGNAKYLKIRESNAEYQQSRSCAEFIAREKKDYDELTRSYRRRGKTFVNTHLVLTPADTFKQATEEYDITYEQIIENLKNSIDHYVEYIDDYEQFRSACDANESIRNRIKKLEALIELR